MRRTTILVADDHAVVREGIVGLLTDHGFDVVGAVADGVALIEAAKRLRPDVIITDLSMPALSGLEALTRLAAEQLSSKVIVLTMHDDPDLATRAVKAGAAGFVLKDAASDELINAIEQVKQGRLYLTPAVTRDIMSGMAASGESARRQLSPRQLEILRLILLGQRMKQIAAALDLSPRTVESHKYEMMEALGVHSTAELVAYAIKHRLVPD
jgi:DNA-binding NarL/FixJ family response regulator